MKTKNIVSHLSKSIVCIALIILLLVSACYSALAAGSYQLGNASGNPNAFRAFSEWANGTSAGITRQTTIYVQANEGETVYFGGSVAGSKCRCYYDDETGKYKTRVEANATGEDIAVISPSGVISAFDVDSTTKVGYLNTYAQEAAGPQYSVNSESYNLDNGYIPLSFTASESGVYEFHFHSSAFARAGTNPTVSKVDVDNATASSGCVAFWDITVVDSENGDPNEDYIQHGREWANYLALNTGSQQAGMYAELFVLTNDGFVYDVSTNGMMPYGFIFFADNIGLVNADTGRSIYHSVATFENSLDSLRAFCNVEFFNPNSDNSDLNSTYRIFFEYPSQEILDTAVSKAVEPEHITDITFEGFKEGNITYEGAGGYFTYHVNHASSVEFEVIIDYTDDDGVVHQCKATLRDVIDPDQESDEYRIYWDGYDEEGNMIPAGAYDTGQITVTGIAKAGEIHFPTFDAENNPYGFKVTMVNDVYASMEDFTPVDNAQKTTIYFNNQPVANGVVESTDTKKVESGGKYTYVDISSGKTVTSSANRFALRDGTYTYASSSSLSTAKGNTGFVEPLNRATTGVDTATTAASVYRFSSKANTGGDQAAIDYWCYYKATTDDIECPVYIVPQDEKNPVLTVHGRVFYDTNATGFYSLNEGDFFLKNIEVGAYYDAECTMPVKDARGRDITTYTDNDGYYISNIPVTTTPIVIPNPDTGGDTIVYQIDDNQTFYFRIVKPNPSFTCTTNNIVQSCTIGEESYKEHNGSYENTDVGLHYKKSKDQIVVVKKWYGDVISEDEIIVQVWYKYTDANGIVHKDNSGYGAKLSAANNWQVTFTELPKYADAAETIPYTYFVEEFYYKTLEHTDEKVLVGVSRVSKDEFDITYSNDCDDLSDYVAAFDYEQKSTTTQQITVTNVQKTYTADVDINIKLFSKIDADFTPSVLNEDFYVGLYTYDEANDEYILTNGVKKCENVTATRVNDTSNNGVTVTFEDMPYGTYYAFQVDEDGNRLTHDSIYEYKIDYPQVEYYNNTVSSFSNVVTVKADSNYHSNTDGSYVTAYITDVHTDEYKVYFLTNREGEKQQVFTYMWSGDLNDDKSISRFYDIPTYEGHVFTGWYFADDTVIAADGTVTTPGMSYSQRNDTVTQDYDREMVWSLTNADSESVGIPNLISQETSKYDATDFTNPNKYTKESYIYAGWVAIDDVNKDSSDKTLTVNTAKGYQLYGTQCRVKGQLQGLRYCTRLSEKFLYNLRYWCHDSFNNDAYYYAQEEAHGQTAGQVNTFVRDYDTTAYDVTPADDSSPTSAVEGYGEVDYGYIYGKTDSLKSFEISNLISKDDFSYLVKGDIPEALTTTHSGKYLSKETPCTAYYRVESGDLYNPAYSTSYITDHNNYSGYRVYTAVMTYGKSGIAEASYNSKVVTPVTFRSFVSYTDANHLQRYYYYDFTSMTAQYGRGLSIDYRSVANHFGINISWKHLYG